MAPLFWFAAGLQIGGWPGGTDRDIDHGVTAEIELRLADHVAARLMVDAGGVAHGTGDCHGVSEATQLGVSAGARGDLFGLREPRRLRPYAAATLGGANVGVTPSCDREYSYTALLVGLAAGADLALTTHIGLRGEARLLLVADPPCCASPNGGELSFALMGTVSF